MKYILIILLSLFVKIGISQELVTWDTSYIERLYSVDYLVWEYENSNLDTTSIMIVTTDTSTLMPIIRNKRDEYKNIYLRDSTRSAQSKIKYDAKLDAINLIESK